jgi:hypothetical protein
MRQQVERPHLVSMLAGLLKQSLFRADPGGHTANWWRPPWFTVIVSLMSMVWPWV